MKKIGQFSSILVLFVLLLTATKALAMSVAVFPVDDLSAAFNSINQVMTEFLRQELTRRGLSVVRPEAVVEFMTAKRIRQLGMLQTQEILAARSDLQADLVLLGTLCQQSEVSAVLGMSISLIRTSDGKTIWTSSKGVSLLDQQRLLGIDGPASMADLQPILARELFVSWPEDFKAAVDMAVVEAQAAAIKEDGVIEVDSVLFTPKYVRPGQEVKCTIRFKVRKEHDMVKVFIRVGNRIHMATSEDGVYYQVSWVGSDDKVGTPLKVAMNTPDSRIVNGLWSGGPQDADYPVSLILEWPSGKRDETYLGSYVVDSQAPTVRFKMQGKQINGITSFRTELPITVLFQRNEPIAHWEFVITSPQGEVLLQEKGKEQPPSQFFWRGQDNRNQRADSGVYAITLKVWDRARNLAQATQKVQLLNPAPGLNLALASRREGIQAQLTPLEGVAIAYWRMELWSPDNTLLQTFEGQTLPCQLLLPPLPDGVDQEKIACVLQVRDALGAQATRRVSDFMAQVAAGDKTSADAPASGNTDENPEDAWQADF